MKTLSYWLKDLRDRTIPIGFVGENLYRRVIINCKEVFDDDPDLVPALSIISPHGEKYPGIVTRDGDLVYWDVQNADLAYKGNGEIQLAFVEYENGQAVEDGIVGRSYTGRFRVERSIIPDGEAPDEIEDFISEASAIVAAIPQTIDDALEEAKESGEFDGEDGYSPTVNITEITGGYRVTIVDKDGTHTADVMDGKDGEPGDDGYSPTVSITSITGGHRITITDKNGDHTADIMDGQDGDPGTPGTPGADGVSPTVAITNITGGHTVTITDKNGSHAFDVMDGVSAINDNAGEGDTDKVWSADKTAKEVSTLSGAINAKADEPTGTKSAGKVYGLNSNLEPEWQTPSGGLPDTTGASIKMLGISSSNTPTWYKTLVTPQMYGAVGNGVADDTTAIQAALNAHKKVYFPQGTYKITEPLVLVNGHTVEGDSKYYATINAIGCDCFQIANGDGGERGSIRNIHLQGDLSSGTKGIKLSNLAPGWSFIDVWIDKFDYGIYGFEVGHVNNIYIDKCIITGKPSTRNFSTCGIYMPSNEQGQMNAITIRDTEINNFKTGITIDGTAISITGCTIQQFENGIVIDSSIGFGGSGTNYRNTFGCVINGCYFEAFDKSAIYCNTGYDNGTSIIYAGGINGLQITNNYIYKAAGDNNYAVIKFAHSNTWGIGGRNLGNPTGNDYAGIFIGMNQISKPSACNAYDLKGCLSRDSIFMQSFAGANAIPFDQKAIGARIIGLPNKKKIVTRFWMFPIWYNQNVTMVDDKTLTINPGGIVRMFVNTDRLYLFDLPISADEYPANIGRYNLWKNAEDGKSYTINANTGFVSDYEDHNWEYDATHNLTNGAISSVGADGYSHWLLDGIYHGSNEITWNAESGFEIIIFASATRTNVFTVKAPTITYWE